MKLSELVIAAMPPTRELGASQTAITLGKRSEAMRFLRVLVLVIGVGSISGCATSESLWVPNESLLAELVKIDPELEPAQVGDVASRFFDDAITDRETGVQLEGRARARRWREAFGAVRARFAEGGAVTVGFNACFPKLFVVPKDSDGSDVSEFMKRGWQCQLIQRNGPSVANLRKDSLVAKYLNEKGDLVAGNDIPLMHADLNGAFLQRNPKDIQVSLYGEARTRYAKIENAWER